MNPDNKRAFYFAINACDRCRKRKARCDPGIPSCQNCQAASSICAYTDARTRQSFPRSQIDDLEQQIAQLEAQIRRAGPIVAGHDDGTREGDSTTVADGRDSGDDGHHPDLIRLEAGEDGHFLGASSGLQLARSVLESARKNSAAFDDQGPSGQSGESQGAAQPEDQTTGTDVNVTEINLPSWETTTRLVDIYFRQYDIQYPILAKAEFMRDITRLYFGSDVLDKATEDAQVIFMLNMVLSISLMSSDDPGSVKLAERFRLTATAHLSNVMHTKNHQTLQCLLLLLLSSTLSSRSAPMWYISGICMRMCVDLGYHSEHTIRFTANSGYAVEDQDTKRRLFWATYTFDRSLARMLGRPFFIEEGKFHVEFPKSSLEKPLDCWLEMQCIQSEIVSNIYVSEQPQPQSPEAESRSLAWKTHMGERLATWLDRTKSTVARGIHTAEWWEYCYQHARLMLNQPKPSASKESLLEAFEAAETMVRLSFIRAHRSAAEFSWLDIHLQLVSGLTLLFLVLKSKDTRERTQSNWVQFKGCIVEWQVVLGKLAKRWTSMVKMKSVLCKLADGILDNIENDKLPEGRGHHRKNHASERQQTRLAIQELHSPSNSVVRTPTPRSPASDHPSTKKRRRGNSSTEGMHAQLDHTSPCGVANSQASFDNVYSYPNNQACGTVFDNLEFPSVLGGDMLTDIDQLGAPLQLDLGLFDQSTDYMSAAVADPFGFQWIGARLDPTLTDSVLSFHGNLEEERARTGDDSAYSAQYE